MIAGKYEERMLKCNFHKTQVKTVNMEKLEDHQLSKESTQKSTENTTFTSMSWWHH